MLNEDESDFKINLKNKNILNNNLIIIYNILIEETYSSTCSINLIINQYEDLMTSQITTKDVPPIKTDIILESKNILKEETTWKTYLNIKENFQTTYSNIEEIERSYQKIENDTIKTYFIEDNYSLNSQQTEYNLISQKILKTENNLNIDNTHKICFDNCEICEEIPEIIEFDNNINQKCLKCIKGYYFEFNTNKCYNDIIMEQGYYFSQNDSMYHKCNIQCKKCEKGGTIDNPNCLTCYNNTYLFLLNNSCINICPSNYEMNDEQNICLLKNVDQTTSLSEFKSQMIKNISTLTNSSNIINGSDFIAMIYSVDDMEPKDQLKKGISAIDLGNCTQIIKDYYNIPKNESFIVLNMETKKNKSGENKEYQNNCESFDLGKNIQIEIYDFSGRKLNLSICKEDIKVMKYIGDVEELNIESAIELANQGIDIFDANDKFFNDICHFYENKDGKDIIINDRRKDIYQNATFCQNGCKYTGMDYELMAANCICDSSVLQNDDKNNIKNDEESQSEGINFKSLSKSFISSLFDFNYKVFECYNLTMNIQILKKNIGFYCMISRLFLRIILLIIYIIKGLKAIKYYMLIFLY